MSGVTVRKRNTWEYRLDFGKVDGKRLQKTKSGFRTKKEAYNAGLKVMQQYENGGQDIPTLDMSVATMFREWLDELSKTELKENTAKNYDKYLRLYIIPELGMYKAQSV